MANARCIRAAQLEARELLFTPVPSGPAASGSVEAVGAGAARPYATTRRRHRARGANSTPNASVTFSSRSAARVGNHVSEVTEKNGGQGRD